jgi:hypothetical protein
MDFKQKLRSCRTCAEAQPILETLRARPAQRKLIETAIQLSQSRDPRQQSYGEDFFITAFREMENDHDKDKKEQEANGGLHRDQGGEADIAGIIDKDEKKTKEADKITGSLESHQSSDIDGLPMEGTDTPENDIESMQGGASSGVSQMGGVKENMPMPGGMGGMPQPGMPPMAPDVQQAMAPQMPKMPPMNTPQMMRQMQYTVDQYNKTLNARVISPLIRELKKTREAVIALDKKYRETESRAGSMKLDIEKVKLNSSVREHVRETVPGTSIEIPQTRFPKAELEQKRYDIAQMDKELSKAQPNPYQ